MFCEKCGNKINPGQSFCNNCGAPCNQNDNPLENPKVNEAKSFITRVRQERNLMALIATVVTLIATYLPYGKVSLWGFSESITYASTDDGKILFVLLIAAGVIYYLKRDGIAFIVSVLALLVIIIDFMGMNDAASQSYGIAQPAIGCYLMILGGIAMVAAPFIGNKVNDAIQKSKEKKAQ